MTIDSSSLLAVVGPCFFKKSKTNRSVTMASRLSLRSTVTRVGAEDSSERKDNTTAS